MSLANYRNKLDLIIAQMPQRDKVALLVLSIFLAALILVYGVFLPSINFQAQARENYTEEQALYSWLNSQRSVISGLSTDLGRQRPKESGSPLTIVNRSAKEFQLTLKRVQPESSGLLRVWVEDASFDNTLKWVDKLNQQGLMITELNVDRVTTGVVNLRLSIAAAAN